MGRITVARGGVGVRVVFFVGLGCPCGMVLLVGYHLGFVSFWRGELLGSARLLC